MHETSLTFFWLDYYGQCFPYNGYSLPLGFKHLLLNYTSLSLILFSIINTKQRQPAVIKNCKSKYTFNFFFLLQETIIEISPNIQ